MEDMMDNLWWKSIPNARLFITDLADKVLGDESVVYTIDNTFPWKGCFTDNLRKEIESATKELRIISASECGNMLPGHFLINKFCKPELKSKYRASVGTERFLATYAESTVLIDSYIMITDCTAEQVQQWNDFISKYNEVKDNDKPSCCFILENSAYNDVSISLENISWEKYYHYYDINMLCLMIASDIKANSVIKSYIAELAVLTCGKDVELAANLADSGIELVENTSYTIKRVVENFCRSDGTTYKYPDELSQKIWEAQIKIFFPIIEKFRSDFIEKNKEAFPENLCYETLFREKITDIHDLELGSLKRLCMYGQLYVSNYDYTYLEFFRKCRNKLAHISVLSHEDIYNMSYYSFPKKNLSPVS